MDSDEITISQLKKRKSQPVSIIKKLRSKIPRRKRFQISPILGKSSFKFFCGDRKPELSVFPVFSSSSCFPDEIDSSSNLISVGSDNVKKLRSARRKKLVEVGRIGTSSRNFRSSDQLKKIPGEECRRLTRSFYRKNETEISSEKGNLEYRPELSESSCVESCSGAVVRTHCINDELSERKLSLKSRARKVVEEAGENEGNEASAAISISETSCIQPISQKKAKRNLRSDKISGKTSTKKAKRSSEVQGQKASEICVIKPAVEANDQNLDQIVGDSSEIIAAKEENRAPEASFSEISKNYVESNMKILNSESTADKKPNDCEFEYALSCSEQFSFEEGSDYSTIPQTTVSELESDIFSGLPEIEFSDYSPSILIESSSSDFSEVSAGNSTPTAYFSFFIQYSKQLSKLNALPDIKDSSDVQEEFTNEFTLLKFEDEIDEDSYNKFRSRERREVILRDYVEDYYTSTAYGDLILRQRLLMVNWIVEQSSARELNYETMFLGVSLFDRFLSKGFFKNKRKLQLVGIACLTLATRIEENQPTNCVRQRTFHVGVNVYSRCEVVAMEWLVQEVLNFQCFLPTSYNFLWFYLKAARAEEKVEERAKYLAMLSLLDHERLCYWPSTVAAGLVILSALVANQDSSCQRVMETHVRTKNDDLPECIRSLEWLVKYVS